VEELDLLTTDLPPRVRHEKEQSSGMSESFEEFMRRRETAARAYVAGDPSLVEALAASDGPATFFDPAGGFIEGAKQVNAANRLGASAFGPKGVTFLEVKDQGVAGDLAFWTGFQDADIEVKATGAIVPMRLRVTEVFRRTEGEWRMVHRHASPARDEG
jgi:ketosteroid isomerase-like protein